MVGGNDVQKRHALDSVGMIERHPVGDARASVVAADEKRMEPERGHHLHLIRRHRTEGVSAVIGPAVRLRAVAVAAQVSSDHRKILGAPRRNLVQHYGGQRIAGQKHQRWTATAVAQLDGRARNWYPRLLEAFEHRDPFLHETGLRKRRVSSPTFLSSSTLQARSRT